MSARARYWWWFLAACWFALCFVWRVALREWPAAAIDAGWVAWCARGHVRARRDLLAERAAEVG